MTKTKSSEKNNSRKYSEKVTSNFEMIKKSIPKENQGEKFRKMYDKEDNFIKISSWLFRQNVLHERSIPIFL